MRTILSALLLLFSTGATAADQPVAIIAAHSPTVVPRRTPAQLVADFQLTRKVFTASSGGQHVPVPQVYGWYVIPKQNCRYMQAVATAIVQAAHDAGAVFPLGAKPIIHFPECDHGYAAVVGAGIGDPNLGRGFTSDGALWSMYYSESLGLGHAYSLDCDQVTGCNGVGAAWNHHDPYTVSSGGTDKAELTGTERTILNWLPKELSMSFVQGQSLSRVFLETLERPLGSGRIKRLQMTAPPPYDRSNLLDIEVRQVLTGTKVLPPPVVVIHRGNYVLDLDEITTCKQYPLPVGQVFRVPGGYEVGIRNDGIVADGAMISVFPYAGASTVACLTPPKK